MFVNSPSGASSYWYDRSAISLAYGFTSTGLAPHAATQRWSYTVPSGRTAMIGSTTVFVGWQSAPGTADIAESYCTVTPSGGTAATINYVGRHTNEQPYNVNQSAVSGAVMMAGDTAAGYTADASSSGTEFYQTGFMGTEFNA